FDGGPPYVVCEALDDGFGDFGEDEAAQQPSHNWGSRGGTKRPEDPNLPPAVAELTLHPPESSVVLSIELGPQRARLVVRDQDQRLTVAQRCEPREDLRVTLGRRDGPHVEALVGRLHRI